jgi:hypothetical protein
MVASLSNTADLNLALPEDKSWRESQIFHAVLAHIVDKALAITEQKMGIFGPNELRLG